MLKTLWRTVKIYTGLVLGFTLGIAAFFLYGQIVFKQFFRPYVVLSGSMEPQIKTGAVVLVRPQEKYKVGDIITFSPGGTDEDLVTHRITSINQTGTFNTKGDANEEIDTWEINSQQIVGKMYYNIPFLGYLVEFAKQPHGFILLVIIPATIIVYEELKSMRKEILKLFKFSKSKKKNGNQDIHSNINLSQSQQDLLRQLTGKTSTFNYKSRDINNKAAVVIPLMGVIFLAGFTVTKSFFMDTEKNTGNSLSAASSFSTPTPLSSPSPSPTPIITPTP